MQAQQLLSNVAAVAESIRSVDELVRSSIAASTTGAVAAVRTRPAPRRKDGRPHDRRVASDVVPLKSKQVGKPLRFDRPLRSHSQAGDGQGSEPRLTHERLQQYATAHARITAASKPSYARSISGAGATLLRKFANLSAALPAPPPRPPSAVGATAAPASPNTQPVVTAVVGTAAVPSGTHPPSGTAGPAPHAHAGPRLVSSAPLLAVSALAGGRLAVTPPSGIPLPGMAPPPVGPRPASALPPTAQIQTRLLQRPGSFPQPLAAPPDVRAALQGANRGGAPPGLSLGGGGAGAPGAPPPERAFGPRAADYPSRTATAAAAPLHGAAVPSSLPGGGIGVTGAGQPPRTPQLNLSRMRRSTDSQQQKPDDPRASPGRGRDGCWMAMAQWPPTAPPPPQPLNVGNISSPGMSPRGHGHPQPQQQLEGMGHGHGGNAAFGLRPGPGQSWQAAGERCSQPQPPPPPHPQQHPQQYPQQYPMSNCPSHHHQHGPPQQVFKHMQQQQQQQQQSPGYTAATPGAPSFPVLARPQQTQGPGMVVGLRDVPPSQLLHAPSSAPQHQQQHAQHNHQHEHRQPQGQQQQRPQQQAEAQGCAGGSGYGCAGGAWGPPRPGTGWSGIMGLGGCLAERRRSSDDGGTHASWWRSGVGDSEASFPMTAVTDRHVRDEGEDRLTPTVAEAWLDRVAELEAEMMEERECRRRYEEELQMLAAAAAARIMAARLPAANTGGGGGAVGAGGGGATGPAWQARGSGGRQQQLTGGRAGAATAMRHRPGVTT